MPARSANIFNVTGQTASILETNYPTGLVGKQRMFCDLNYCYHVYSSRNGDAGTSFQWYITKWIRNSTHPFYEIIASNSFQEFNPISYSITPNNLAFDVMDYDNDKFYMIWINGTAPNRYLNRYWVYKDNLTLIKDTDVPSPKVSGAYEFTEIELGEEFSVIYTNNSGLSTTPNKIKKLYFTEGNINGTLEQYYTHAHNINYLYIPEVNEKYLFFSNDTSAYLYRINNVDNVITYYDITTGYVVNKDDYITPNALYQTKSIYAYYYNGIVYFAIRQYRSSTNDNNNTWYVNAISPTETKNSGSLKLLGSGQYLDLSQYDSWLGNDTYFTNNQSTALSFYYDDYPAYEQWYILYQRQVATSNYGGLEIMFLPTYKSCVCSDWINSSQCGYDANGFRTPNVLWQVRTCNPSQCDSLGQFVDCTEEAPTIKYKLMSKCQPCNGLPSTVWKDKPNQLYAGRDGSVRCDNNVVDIPINATNITSQAMLSIYANRYSYGWFVPDKNFTVTLCNPKTTGNCIEGSYSCKNDYNLTLTLDYNSYQAGQQATTDGSAKSITNCAGTQLLPFDPTSTTGWQDYYFLTDLCVFWSQPCGGYQCVKVGDNYYEQQETADCIANTTSRTLCQYGCDISTNRCKSQAILPSQFTGDPFTMIQNLAEGSFSSMVLMGFSIFTSIGTAVYSFIYTHNDKISLMVFFSLILFFTILLWLPTWFGLMITIGIVLLLGKSLFLPKGE